MATKRPTKEEVYARDRDPEVIARRTALFKQYIEPNLDFIHSLCKHYSFDQQCVDERYNDVLLNFYRSIESYNVSMSLKTWIHIVTKRHVLRLEKQDRRVHEKIEMFHICDVEELCDFDVYDADREELDIDHIDKSYNDDILEALAKLKPEHRALVLLDQAGYNSDEMAVVMHKMYGLSLTSGHEMRSRLRKINQKLRKMITRNGDKREE